MYQIEVKYYLIQQQFPPSDGWEVTVDLDAMELGRGGQHPQGKAEIAEQCKTKLEELGVRIGPHPVYRRADVVATHPSRGTFVVEVEGRSSRQAEQALYSALGQILLVMDRFGDDTTYGIAAPDLPKWWVQFGKVPIEVCQRLNLQLFLVSDKSIESFGPK